MDNNKNKIDKLDPKKYVTRKIFRKYKKSKPIEKPKREHFLIEFPRRTKEAFFNIGSFIFKNIGKIIILVLFALIILFIILSFLEGRLEASFIDKSSGDYIYGYVYFDNKFIGDTDGAGFDSFPGEYCEGSHIVRLESENDAFEWSTYPFDCKKGKVIFYVEHEKAKPSKNIIFKFLDRGGSFDISGKLYFDDFLIGEVNKSLSISRLECKNISKIRLEHDTFYNEWWNNIEFCDIYDEIEFKTK